MKSSQYRHLACGLLTLTLILASVTVPNSSASPRRAAAGDIVINEIMQNPSAVSDSDGEWFELHNATGSAIDIDGWTIRDDGSDSHLIANDGSLEIPPGGFLVLGRNGDTTINGGVTVDYAYGSNWYLANGDDEIVLLDGNSTEIDRVAYDGGTTFPDPSGAAMALADPVLDNADGANWCVATTPYGDGDAGTPGLPNDCSSTPPSAPEVSIYDIQYTEDASGNSPYAGQTVTTEGVVTAAFYGGERVWIQDGEGPWSGLYIYEPSPPPTIGDRVEVTGPVEEYYGLTEINGGEVRVLSSGNPLPAPEILPTGNVNQEQWENVLVRVEDVTVTDILSYGEWEVNDGSGAVVVDDMGDYGYAPTAGDDLNFVQGPLTYSYGAFKIEPRGDDDIGTTETPTPGPDPNAPELLLTEIVVTPTGGEFVEIHNPTNAAIDLTDVYLTDATYAPGDTYYYNIVTGSGAGGGGFADFHARFPDGAAIGSGEYQTIALAGSDAFFLEYGVEPTYELYEDGDTSDGIPDMLEAFTGSVDGQGGLSNSGEVAILYYWDGESDLVTDLDYAVWGDKNEAVDKSGVALDGPDGDAEASAYLADTAIDSQDTVAGGSHASGNAWHRWDLDEGAESETGGNGVGGDDETSEDLSNTWCEDVPTPGEASACEPVLTGECGDPATLISAVQGDGATSPLVGTQVVIEGIVVGDFQWGGTDDGDLGGFFVQEEDDDTDGNPLTSEGVFVYDGGFGVDVETGDRVRVNGVASEYYGLTQIGSLDDVLKCGSGNTVTAADVTLPLDTRDDLEAYEGMSIVMSQELVISEFYNFDRYGEIVLTLGRQFQPTAIYDPGSSEATALAQANRLSRIQLEDGRTTQNPDPARHPNGMAFDLTNRFRGGDTVQNVVGVLGYGFGEYQIQPTAGAVYEQVNERPDSPEDVGGSIKVAAFNVLNYFTTLDDGTDVCGPLGNQECRGADTAEEFERQQAKIVAAMCAIDADVFGLMELENQNPDNDPEPGDGIANYVLKNLVDALNAEDSPCEDKSYAFTDSPAVGTDAIRQAIIYKTDAVTPLGRAVLDDPSFTDPNDLGEQKNRPAIAETFMDKETGGIFTAVVNHLKSKGSPCGPGDDDPMAGNCNLTRALAAQALADWLDTDPTESGDSDFLIIGDLNAYDKEDPIDVLKANGYVDLLLQDEGEYAYSYVFDGQLGYLDYGMPNQALLPEVTGVTAWHINADEPDILDYDTTYKKPAQDALYEVNAYRSSDHDPVIVGLDVCDEIAPTLDVTVSPDTLWPPNHRYVTVVPTIAVSDNFDPDPTVTLVSVESNEPDNGRGDGNTTDDIVINEDGTIDLRAERSGTGDGRIYTITYRATDACGNSTEVSVTVTVPHNQGKGRGGGK